MPDGYSDDIHCITPADRSHKNASAAIPADKKRISKLVLLKEVNEEKKQFNLKIIILD